MQDSRWQYCRFQYPSYTRSRVLGPNEIVIRDTGVSIDATDSNFSAIEEAQGDRRGAECVFDLQTDNRAVLEQT